MALQQDFRDLLSVFAEEGVSYLLIGGYAVTFHSRPRFTKDIDLWIADDPENVERVIRALARFGAPRAVLDALRTSGPDEIVFFGAPPVRVEIFKRIPGATFEEAYVRRVESSWGDVQVSVIGREDLIRAKRASGRPEDLRDAETLERSVD